MIIHTHRPNDKIGEAAGAVADKTREVKDSLIDAVTHAKDRLSGATAHAKDQVSAAYDSASERTKSAARKAKLHKNRTFSQASNQVGQLVSRSKERYRDGLRENPLGLLIGALGIGGVAGILAPVSRREDEFFGETSDQVTEEIKDEVGDDRVGFVAAAISFYFVIALVPLLTSFVRAYGLFSFLRWPLLFVGSIVGISKPFVLASFRQCGENSGVPHFLVIGGGPAGLRAAEVASASGATVTLCEQKRSVGRKFLVAGKGGLNLTHSEDLEKFVPRYRGPGQPEDFWARALERFDNKAIRAWAALLDVGTFVQKSGRVYPKALKAAPLLRRWVERLRAQGVDLKMQHRLTKLSEGAAEFETPEGLVTIKADALILALGGGSWPETGSDGAWVDLLKNAGVEVANLSAANCGWEVAWPDGLGSQVEGQPLKNVFASASGEEAPGEIMLTTYGLEGGPLYQLGPVLRAMAEPEIVLDLKPTFTAEKLVAKMESAKRNFLVESESRWKLSDPMRKLLEHFHGPFDSASELARHTKACRIPLTRARPLAEAISSAGGVKWTSVDDQLMIRDLPGVFVAGEMIDWEAPTGGYLLQGCFASGTLAAEAALAWVG